MNDHSLHGGVQQTMRHGKRDGRVLMFLVVSSGAGLLGFLMAGKFAGAMFLGCVALVLILLFARSTGFGGLIALFLVGLGNGLPLIDLSVMNRPGSFSYVDPLMGCLILLGCAYLYSLRKITASANAAPILWSVCAFVFYWCVVVLKTTIGGRVPLVGTLLYGRNFLAILLVPVMVGVASEWTVMHSFTRWFVWLCALFGMSQAFQTFGGLDLDIMTHPLLTNTTAGLSRVYSTMQPLTAVALFMCVPLYKWAESSRERLGALSCATVLTFAIAAQLSRALWLALAAGFVVACLFAYLARLKRTVRKRRLSAVTASVPFIVLLLGGVLSLARRLAEVQQLVDRLETSFLDFATQGGTFGYRLLVYREVVSLMRGHWLTGLGFLHPKYVYIAGLPGGGLQNSDLGILSVLATMGFIGVLLLTLPAWISLARASFALRSGHSLSTVSGWVAIALLSAALISSPTLTWFASQTGLAAVSIAVAFSTMRGEHGAR